MFSHTRSDTFDFDQLTLNWYLEAFMFSKNVTLPISQRIEKHFFSYLLISVVALSGFSNKALSQSNDASITAEKVMQDVDDRDRGQTRQMTGTLSLLDKNGGTRVRNFQETAKKYGRDEKSISIVTYPAEVKGTSIMAYNWKDKTKDDDTWLYLPQLKKVKRRASTDKSGYFLGSDFTYSDFVGLEVSDFKYSFDSENNKADGKEWVIIAEPADDIAQKVKDETGYKKIKYWVDKTSLLIVKAIYWLEEGNKIKYSSSSEIEKVEDIWTVKKMQMVMTQGGNKLHSSVFQLENVKYNLPIDDTEFTVYAMERENK